MNDKCCDYLYVFETAHAAIAAEQALLGGDLAVRVMPVPTAIAAGCGIGLRVPKSQLVQANTLLKAQEIANDVHHVAPAFPLYQAKALFSPALGLIPGDALAIVGCGGKTALLHRLAAELRSEIVLLATTTRILFPTISIDNVCPPALQAGVNLFHGGFGDDNKKLLPPDLAYLETLRSSGDYTLLECDGSKGLSLKGWAEYEPAVPSWSTVTVGVCTLWPVSTVLSEENVHRPDIFSRLTGAKLGDVATFAHVAAMISHEDGLFGKAVGRRYLFLNQVESEEQMTQALELVAILPQMFKDSLTGILAGSVQQGTVTLLSGEAK